MWIKSQVFSLSMWCQIGSVYAFQKTQARIYKQKSVFGALRAHISCSSLEKLSRLIWQFLTSWKGPQNCWRI